MKSLQRLQGVFFTFKKFNNVFMFLKLGIGWLNFKSQKLQQIARTFTSFH